MSRRCTLLLLAATALGACTAGGNPPAAPAGAPGEEAAADGTACSLPVEQLARIRSGYHPRRSGDIQIVPREPNFVFGARLEGGLSHAGPWDYLQRVPLLLYGPGHVPPTGPVDRPVTLADVAPTLAGYLGFPFEAPDGEAVAEALPPVAPGLPPRLILVVVWDGAGRNVLSEWPEAWPTLRSLIDRGVWLENATVGSSPSTTPVVHTTLGTGALPRRHGIVDMQFRAGGRMVPAFDDGPGYLLAETLADRYDLDRGNAPHVAVVASHPWHLGMIGHGSSIPHADRDLVVLQDERTGRWKLTGANARVFRFPPYVNDVRGLRAAVRRLDLEDGRSDRVWLGEPVLRDPADVLYTPASVEWQTRVLEEMIEREGFGADEVPDLLFTNYKLVDRVGHRWSMHSPQMEAAVRASDAALGRLVRLLNREVGRARWVLALTADHGVTPSPDRTGAATVSTAELQGALEDRFDRDADSRPAILRVRPTQIWVDREELRGNGFDLQQVARFILRHPWAQGGGARPGAPFFAAAFPADRLAGPCPG